MIVVSQASRPRLCSVGVGHRRSATRHVAARSRTEGGDHKGGSGIHDPLGWGMRSGDVKPLVAAQEEGRQQQVAHLAAAEARSSQATHPGSASIDRHEAAQREILAVEQEKAAAAQQVEQEWAAAPRELSPSDDEWERMPTSKKWWMEAKAMLYSWLGTGVEPL